MQPKEQQQTKLNLISKIINTMATPKQYREFNKHYNDFINTEEGKFLLNNITEQFDDIDIPEIIKAKIIDVDNTCTPNEAIILFTEMKEEIIIDKAAGKNINQNELDLYEMLINRYENRKKELETPIETETKQKVLTTPQPHKEEIKTLNELFKNPVLYEDCLQLLRDEDKTIINNENSFIANNKGVIVVWYLLLQNRGIIEKVKNDVQRAIILNKTFSNYNVSESLFRAKNERANEEYYNHFSTELTAINAKKH